MAVRAKSVNLTLLLETQDERDVRSESLLHPETLMQRRGEGGNVASWGKAEFSGFRRPNARNSREGRAGAGHWGRGKVTPETQSQPCLWTPDP